MVISLLKHKRPDNIRKSHDTENLGPITARLFSLKSRGLCENEIF